MRRSEKFKKVLEYFQVHQPVAETELHYSDPYQLIVAVILSAQCTDKRVNMITPSFFKEYPDVLTLSQATPETVFQLIKSCSYPNNKAKHLVGMARMLVTEFQGIVPAETEELLRLPGVGRKTANVIASVIYAKPALAVDTHVFRVAARIGLTVGAKTPLAAEKQLMEYIPEKLIPIAHHWLILHGRYVCTARKPKCYECKLLEFCNYKEKNLMQGGKDS